MGNSELPQEILLEIFSRTPAKSVGKCRAISKSWNNHLSTPNFINKHLVTRKQTIQQLNLALVTKDMEVYIITSPTKSDEDFNSKGFPHMCYTFLGTCNGLILVNGHGGLTLINPITRKKVNVEPLNMIYSYTVTGFGYDSCCDDYKLVRLGSLFSRGLCKTFVDVYSFKKGVWKSLDDGFYPYGGLVPERYGLESGAFVNGALHWLICITSKECYCSCIAAFDLANEVFRKIPLPEEFVSQLDFVDDVLPLNSAMGGRSWPRNYGVSVVSECLLIVDNFGNGVTEVWIMKEYGVVESWVKFRIGAENVIWRPIFATLCCVGDGELLCLSKEGYLFACDLKGGTVRKVVFGEYYSWFFHGIAFVDSLVFPEVSS